MELVDYKKFAHDLTHGDPYKLKKGIEIMFEIFIQDCMTSCPQKYFGSITKEKAKLIFNLRHILYERESIKNDTVI